MSTGKTLIHQPRTDKQPAPIATRGPEAKQNAIAKNVVRETEAIHKQRAAEKVDGDALAKSMAKLTVSAPARQNDDSDTDTDTDGLSGPMVKLGGNAAEPVHEDATTTLRTALTKYAPAFSKIIPFSDIRWGDFDGVFPATKNEMEGAAIRMLGAASGSTSDDKNDRYAALVYEVTKSVIAGDLPEIYKRDTRHLVFGEVLNAYSVARNLWDEFRAAHLAPARFGGYNTRQGFVNALTGWSDSQYRGMWMIRENDLGRSANMIALISLIADLSEYSAEDDKFHTIPVTALNTARPMLIDEYTSPGNQLGDIYIYSSIRTMAMHSKTLCYMTLNAIDNADRELILSVFAGGNMVSLDHLILFGSRTLTPEDIITIADNTWLKDFTWMSESGELGIQADGKYSFTDEHFKRYLSKAKKLVSTSLYLTSCTGGGIAEAAATHPSLEIVCLPKAIMTNNRAGKSTLSNLLFSNITPSSPRTESLGLVPVLSPMSLLPDASKLAAEAAVLTKGTTFLGVKLLPTMTFAQFIQGAWTQRFELETALSGTNTAHIAVEQRQNGRTPRADVRRRTAWIRDPRLLDIAPEDAVKSGTNIFSDLTDPGIIHTAPYPNSYVAIPRDISV